MTDEPKAIDDSRPSPIRKECPVCRARGTIRAYDSVIYDKDYKCDLYVHAKAHETCFQRPGFGPTTVKL